MTKPAHEIHFTVDKKHCTTIESKLTVAKILELGEKMPTVDYYIKRKEKGQDVDYKEQTTEVEVHDGDKFLAVFTGPMTTS